MPSPTASRSTGKPSASVRWWKACATTTAGRRRTTATASRLPPRKRSRNISKSIVVVDLAGLDRHLMIGRHNLEAAFQVAELDLRLGTAHAREQVVGELVHVPLGRVGRQA